MASVYPTAYHQAHALFPEYEISKPHRAIISTIIEESTLDKTLHPSYLPETSDQLWQNAKREFFEKRDRLQADAENYFKQLHDQNQTSLPDRANLLTKLVQLPPETVSQPGLIQHVMPLTQGLVLGEVHAETGSKQFLIDNMAELSRQGVRTLYMEHLLFDIHQSTLDEYFLAPESEMPDLLKHYLNNQDSGHSLLGHFATNYNFLAVVEAAKQARIRVVAIDCTASYQQNGITKNSNNTTRHEMMNYFAEKMIRHYQSSPAAGKWIALVGNTHMNTFSNVYGLAELTGTIGIRIANGLENKVMLTDSGLSAGEKYGYTTVKGDLLLQVKSKKEVKEQLEMQKEDLRKRLSLQLSDDNLTGIPHFHEIDSYAAVPMKLQGEMYRALQDKLKLLWTVTQPIERLWIVVDLCELSARYLAKHSNDFSFFSRNDKINALKNKLDPIASDLLRSLADAPEGALSNEFKLYRAQLESLYTPGTPAPGAVAAATRHLGAQASDPVHNSAVERWLLPPDAVESLDGGDTQYQKQFIIQMEDDAVVRTAAANLLGKHPEGSMLVQLDAEGMFRVLERQADGTWRRLTADESINHLRAALKDVNLALKDPIRLQLVAHGRNAAGETDDLNNSTMAGLTPETVAKNLKKLFAITGKTLNYSISLVGCALTDESGAKESFAGRLMRVLCNQGVSVERLAARVESFEVNQGGAENQGG